ncbi:hypothetical protein C6Q19_29720 [Burkholderia cenocepacia]|nr:hypothetical protein C6Q19_29720 [Burkholderia cenocepacia]
MMGRWVGNLPEVDYAEETRMRDAVAFYRSGYEKARTCQEFRVLRSVKRSQLMAAVNRSPNRMAN